MDKVILLFLSWCGLGFMPKAPGTWGSIGGLIVLFLLPRDFAFVLIYFLIILLLSYFLTEYHITSKKIKDPQYIVIDEVLGVTLPFIFIPVRLDLLLLGFFLFRFFDILKPLGIKWFEKLPGAIGVIADDLIAGLYSLVILIIYIQLRYFVGI